MKLLAFLVVLFVVPLVAAQLIVTPQQSSVSVTWNVPSTFSVAIRNNDTIWAHNISFSPTASFTFPVGVDLAPNESRVFSYQVLTNRLFASEVYVSTLSYFFEVPASLAPRNVSVNITDAGFVPNEVEAWTNDTLVFTNKLGVDVSVRVLGTNEVLANVPAGGSASFLVDGEAGGFTFYASPQGFTGLLAAVPPSNVSLAHDSTLDQTVSFVVNSHLNPSALQVTLLSPNITVVNNATYPQALIEIRNNDPALLIQGVNLTADRWVASFSPNVFSVPAGGVQRVLFDIHPFVSLTTMTNRSQNIHLTLRTSNAGTFTKDISVFIPYMDMSVVNIGGVNYTINVLGINDTIEACLQHMNDQGFEECKKLGDYFRTNVTVIKEIEPQYKFGEAVVSKTITQMTTVGDVAERLQNTMNEYLDKQASVEAKVDNMTVQVQNLTAYVLAHEASTDEELHYLNTRFWVWVGVFAVVVVIVALLKTAWSLSYLAALERARQI